LGGLDGVEGFGEVTAGDRITFFFHGQPGSTRPAPDSGDIRGWAAILAEALTEIHKHGAAPPVSDEPLYAKAMTAMLGRLDRFSHYVGGEDARAQQAVRDGYGGVGMTLDYAGVLPRIVDLVQGGPSAAAGLALGDALIAIEGAPVRALGPDVVAERLRGVPDTKVTVTVLRPGRPHPLSVAITRRLIVPPTVTVDHDRHIATLRLSMFNRDTANAVEKGLHGLQDEMGGNLHGLILDLRGNPGGLLEQGAAAASLFLDGGVVATTRGRHPDAHQTFEAHGKPLLPTLPMVVLVDGDTASAAEVLTAAFQDRRRAVVVGSASFGKGTVQIALPLVNQGEMTLTWARLFTPLGTSLADHGVVPGFCTARETGSASAAAAVEHVLGAGLAPTPLALRPRAELDEAQWRELRASCPPRPAHAADPRADLDTMVARRLLADPALYREALDPPGIAIAQTPQPH